MKFKNAALAVVVCLSAVLAEAAFAGNTAIEYCEAKNYSISIDALSYARDAAAQPTLLMNGTTNSTINMNTTYAFLANFRFGTSPPITAQNGSFCGNLTSTDECPLDGAFGVNLTLPDFPVYLFPAIVNVTLSVFGEEGVEELCLRGPLMPFGLPGGVDLELENGSGMEL